METNNKLRESLKAAKQYLDGYSTNILELRRKVDASLAEPVRNCEVGTAMEQGGRFSAYCRAHKHPESECLPCPLFGQTGGYCELAWAQMPYEAEKGGAT